MSYSNAKKNSNALKNQRLLLLLVLLALYAYLMLTGYLLWIKSTSESYSLFQTWKQYFSVEDWNMTMHAVTDIDGDGQRDLVTFANCAFLTTVSAEAIPEDRQCQDPSIAGTTFPNQKDIVGQNIGKTRPFFLSQMRKSFLVETQDGEWKYYDNNGWRLSVFLLGENNLFQQVEPSLLDWIDAFAYQFSHIGVAIFLALLTPFFAPPR